MGVDDALIAVEVAAPKAFNQLAAIPDATWIAHEGGKQIKFERCQIERLGDISGNLAMCDPLIEINRKMRCLVAASLAALTQSSPQQRPDTSHEFSRAKGLDHIVISPG